MSRDIEEPQKHLDELDGIRGLAILGVLCSHGVGLTGFFSHVHPTNPQTAVLLAMSSLWGGVDLFFTLSGFLITGILLRTKANRNYFSSFYGRRVLRIFPVYYFALIATLIAAHYSSIMAGLLPQWNSWRLSYFFYLQNCPAFWHGEKMMGGVWGAYWSLAVEEQFYLIWPIVILLCSERTIIRICKVGFALALPLRILLCHLYFGSHFGLAQITSSRVDGLFLGAGCATFMYLYRKPVPIRAIAMAFAIGIAIMGYIALFHTSEFFSSNVWIITFGISGYALLSVALVALSQHHLPTMQRVLTLGWLRTVGKYSYGMYVYHLLLILPLRERLLSYTKFSPSFSQGIALMVAEMTVIFLLAKVSYDLFEVRFLQLKRYFSPIQELRTVELAA